MLLFCPRCGAQHIDAPETKLDDQDDRVPVTTWTNPPHRSHLCHACGTIWRPSDVPTNGVAALQTRGKADTWDGKSEPRSAATESDLSALLPGTYYMDPPDGGDVSLLEQLRRMAADAARYRSVAAFNDEARELLYGNLDTIQSAIALADATGNSSQARGLEAVEYQIRRLFAAHAQGGDHANG
ncbi:hypothetical protein WM08_14900 [Burkholderia ubonensis]|nr:hypothetical protein WM08_14900 [Burkholderia ubonensis]